MVAVASPPGSHTPYVFRERLLLQVLQLGLELVLSKLSQSRDGVLLPSPYLLAHVFPIQHTGHSSPAGEEEEEGGRQILLPPSKSFLVPGGSQQTCWRPSAGVCCGMMVTIPPQCHKHPPVFHWKISLGCWRKESTYMLGTWRNPWVDLLGCNDTASSNTSHHHLQRVQGPSWAPVCPIFAQPITRLRVNFQCMQG